MAVANRFGKTCEDFLGWFAPLFDEGFAFEKFFNQLNLFLGRLGVSKVLKNFLFRFERFFADKVTFGFAKWNVDPRLGCQMFLCVGPPAPKFGGTDDIAEKVFQLLTGSGVVRI